MQMRNDLADIRRATEFATVLLDFFTTEETAELLRMFFIVALVSDNDFRILGWRLISAFR